MCPNPGRKLNGNKASHIPPSRSPWPSARTLSRSHEWEYSVTSPWGPCTACATRRERRSRKGAAIYCAHNDKGEEQPCEEHEEYTEAQNDVAQLPVPGVGGWPEEAKPLLIILRDQPQSSAVQDHIEHEGGKSDTQQGTVAEQHATASERKEKP